MRKTYALRPEGKNPDRVLEAAKHDIRRYMRRERRRDLPAGTDFWAFDCRFGADKDSAQPLHPAELIAQLDVLAQSGAAHCYVELLARPAVRQARVAGAPSADEAAEESGEE